MTSVPPKAFRCTVYEEPATLGKIEDVLYVFYDDGRMEPFEVPMAPFTCVLGEIGISECQALADKRHGNAAMIACTRLQEVQ